METGLIVLTVFVFLYAISSKRLSVTILTGPLVFATLGLVIGPEVLDIVGGLPNLGAVTAVLEATLVLVLFTDALSTNTSNWRAETSIPGRLLGIGLLLTFALGWGTALLLFADLEFWEAGLIAIILTPTDAALGQAVVSNPRVPQRIRTGLNVESGLNDGLALPIFFVLLEAAETAATSLSFSTFAVEIAREVGIALLIGGAVGWTAAWLIRWASNRDWVAQGWRQISLLGVAFAVWLLAEHVGGSGFLAAWTAGLVIGRELRDSDGRISELAEDTGHLLTLISFSIFGVVVLGTAITNITWEAGLYAVLSLTLIRMLPVAVAMIGSGLAAPSVAYLGWFGPRGLASIILVLTIVDESDLAGLETITLAMAATVGLSIYAHGITAWWGSNRYADWYAGNEERHGTMPEAEDVAPVPVSRRLGRTE